MLAQAAGSVGADAETSRELNKAIRLLIPEPRPISSRPDILYWVVVACWAAMLGLGVTAVVDLTAAVQRDDYSPEAMANVLPKYAAVGILALAAWLIGRIRIRVATNEAKRARGIRATTQPDV